MRKPNELKRLSVMLSKDLLDLFVSTGQNRDQVVRAELIEFMKKPEFRPLKFVKNKTRTTVNIQKDIAEWIQDINSRTKYRTSDVIAIVLENYLDRIGNKPKELFLKKKDNRFQLSIKIGETDFQADFSGDTPIGTAYQHLIDKILE